LTDVTVGEKLGHGLMKCDLKDLARPTDARQPESGLAGWHLEAVERARK
jgi:hypothetical protein